MHWEWVPDMPAEACTELGCDDDDAALPMSTAERQVNWLVRAGIGVATLSLLMVMTPG